jgi:hypothetical protein
MDSCAKDAIYPFLQTSSKEFPVSFGAWSWHAVLGPASLRFIKRANQFGQQLPLLA